MGALLQALPPYLVVAARHIICWTWQCIRLRLNDCNACFFKGREKNVGYDFTSFLSSGRM